MKETTEPTTFFWDVVHDAFEDGPIERGTMMGFPCLRLDGHFFASVEPRSGDLIVKLPAPRVQELIRDGVGQPFAPVGRPFREWVLVSDRDVERWTSLLYEALAFAE